MPSGTGAAEKNASSGSASASDASDPGARSAGDPSVSSSSSSAAPTLPSAARLFLHIKKVFRRCSNLTRGKPLLALHGAFVRVARAYAGRLVDRAEASGRFLADVKVKRDPARIADEYRAPIAQEEVEETRRQQALVDIAEENAEEARTRPYEEEEYRQFPVIGSRVVVWILAQLHLYFAAFVLAAPLAPSDPP